MEMSVETFLAALQKRQIKFGNDGSVLAMAALAFTLAQLVATASPRRAQIFQLAARIAKRFPPTAEPGAVHRLIEELRPYYEDSPL